MSAYFRLHGLAHDEGHHHVHGAARGRRRRAALRLRLATYSTYWQNRTCLYGTNYFGRLYVEGDMEIADGQTTLVTASQGIGENAALYVMGNGTGYSVKKGHLLISGGRQSAAWGRGDFCQILDAPAGHVGQFAVGNVAAPWHVRYTATAAYLFCQKGTVLVFR